MPIEERQFRGVIVYPCCQREKVLVYEDTHGGTSNKCPRCGSFAEFNYDNMTARPVQAARGAYKKMKYGY